VKSLRDVEKGRTFESVVMLYFISALYVREDLLCAVRYCGNVEQQVKLELIGPNLLPTNKTSERLR
jgi:hypothetical protein